MILWIVGRQLTRIYPVAWDFMGVYDNENDAIQACLTEDYFIGPAKLNMALPDEVTEWPGCWYPLHKGNE